VTAVAGTWVPVITDQLGFYTVDPSCPEISVPLTVSSVTPSERLNPAGGNILQVVGGGFPQNLADKGQLSLNFSDGSQCTVISLSSTRLMCLTSPFNSSVEGSSRTLAVIVNGVEDSSQVITIDAVQAKILSLTPSSVSPILKRLLTIVVRDYPYTLDKNDIEVVLQSQKDLNN
jgi:hypothetical protein